MNKPVPTIGLFTCAMICLAGCFRWQQDSDLEPIPALEAKVRMEFIENQVNRDSLVDVFVGIHISHALPGRAYNITADVEFVDRAKGKSFGEIHTAQDTLIDLSWVFTEEIKGPKGIQGITLRAAFKIDAAEIGRDSAIYY